MKIIFILFFALSLPFSASADVLFLDLNLSYKEVEAAREAAKARVENLIVLPYIPKEERENLLKKQVEYDKVKAARDKIWLDYISVSVEIDNLTEKLMALQNRGPKNWQVLDATKKIELLKTKRKFLKEKEDKLTRDSFVKEDELALEKAKYPLTKESINQALSSLEENHKQLSSLIISGHHVDTFFGSQMYSLSTNDIDQIFKDHPALKADLRSLYLWGCYSATISSANAWSPIFPNLALLVGFNGSAPSQGREVDMEYLKSIMKKEKSLILSGDAKKIQQNFLQVKGILAANASMIYCDQFYIDKKLADSKTSEKVCSVLEFGGSHLAVSADQMKSFHTDFFLNFKDGFYEDVPANTQESGLRKYYNLLRSYGHCKYINDYANTISTVLRLIFFHQIRDNFFLKYPDEVSRLNQWIQESNPSLSMDGLVGKEPRNAYVQYIKYINKYITAHPEDKNIENIKKSANLLNKTLLDFNCVPISWVEPATNASSLESVSDKCLQE